MAVSNTKSIDRYDGNGTDPYQITFDFDSNASYIEVDVYDADGVLVASDLTNGSGITVSGNELTTDTSYDDTHTIVIRREVPYTQPTDLTASGTLPVETLENMVDNVVYQTQQIKNELSSVITLASSDTEVDPLPPANLRAGLIAAFVYDEKASLTFTTDSALHTRLEAQATSDATASPETLLTTDASGNLTLNQANVHVVSFDTSNGGPTNLGELAWDSTDGTLDLIIESGVKVELGEKNLIRVRNTSGSTIAKGAPLVFTGTNGATGRVNVAAWVGANTTDPQTFVGFAAAAISNNANGYAVAFGKVIDINTDGSLYSETWNDGDILYAVPSSSSELTKVKPTSGKYVVAAAVINAGSGTSGSLLVRPSVVTEFDQGLNTSDTVAFTEATIATFNATTITSDTANLTNINCITVSAATENLTLAASGGDVILDGTNRGAAIADHATPASATNEDIATKQNAILAVLRSHGLIES